MTYDAIFARSFSKSEQKKFGFGALFGCLIIALTIFCVFKPYIGHLRVKLQLSLGVGSKILWKNEETTETLQPYIITKRATPVCNVTRPRADVCDITGDVRIHGNSSTIFIASNESLASWNESWIIRPYARKGDRTAMGRVTQLTIKTAQESRGLPICSKKYNVPAIVFSTGGYSGNHFHTFTDILIPLYLTSQKFKGQVQFLATNKQSWWIAKYKPVLEKLSKYEIIDIDKENRVFCFPSMIVGLKAHKEFTIDPTQFPYSMANFIQFLRNTYSLKRERVSQQENGGPTSIRPRLLIISRVKTRRLLNGDEIADMARGLGFEAVVKETTSNVSQVAKFVNSFDVMIGVHGAGLTNMVFLPENAVVIQIIPLGGLEWLARTDFKVPAEDMKLRYLDYKISVNESSLIQQYPLDHEVLKNPGAIIKRGHWQAFSKVYLSKQDVKLNAGRFRHTLLKALKLLR